MDQPIVETLRLPGALLMLTPFEYELAMTVAARRLAYNYNQNDARHYKKELMEDDRTAEMAGTVCELAVARYTNRYWHASSFHNKDKHIWGGLPDVGRNIEVRRLRTSRSIAVRKHQLNMGLVLWAAHPKPPEFRVVELLGWLPYDEAWSLAVPSNYDPQGTRVVDIDKLILPEGKINA